MKVHANILDTILNTSTKQSNFGSPNLGDAFLDGSYRRNAQGTGAWASRTASAIEGDGPLAEAFASVESKQAKVASARESKRFGSVKEALHFVASLTPKKGAKLSSTVQARFAASQQAAARLTRLLNKTAAQMKQDGASKLADYFDPQVVPAWAKQARADFATIQALRNEFGGSAKTAAEDVVKDRGLSDAEVTGYVAKLLNEGMSPKRVNEKLAKLAELQGFSRGVATAYLDDHAGLLGYAYMEPNHYMDKGGKQASSSKDCVRQATGWKAAGITPSAKSVRQITACKGCQYLKQASGMKTCSLYHLPVVANQSELLPIINNLVPGARNKRAALVARANGEHMQVAQPKQASSQFSRTGATGAVLVNNGGVAEGSKKTAALAFNGQTVLDMHNAGKSMAEIYTKAVAVAGVRVAKKACRDFVKGLKGTQTKIALSQIDCTIIPGKLASSNAIYGAKKCGSCTYRSGMHCGLTGGTLAAFPGMEKASRSRVASSAADGLSLVKEFEMTRSKVASDIDMSRPAADDIEMSPNSQMEL